MITDQEKEYKEEKEKAEEYYKTISKTKCPFFNNHIVFNSEGFNHLIYKSGKERPKKEQIMRFKLINKAKTLLGSTNTHQDCYEETKMIKKKRRKKTITESATIKYWGFIAIINNIRIKVVVRKVGNGNVHFWSVIPAWNTRYYQGNKVIENFDNDLDI